MVKCVYCSGEHATAAEVRQLLVDDNEPLHHQESWQETHTTPKK